jgi:hypothetical protein
VKGVAFENSFGAQDEPRPGAVFFDRSVRILGASGEKPAMVAQQRRKGLFVEPDQQKERFFHGLFVFDLDQGVQEQGFRLRGIAAGKSFFHGNPQVVGIVKQEPIQSEPFFHFSFYKISLNRVPDLAVNRDGEPAARSAGFQKI